MNDGPERFSLLLLEPHEILFQDFSVNLLNYGGNSHQGKLKLCCKSVVFVPKENLDVPVIRLCYRDAETIRASESHENAIEIKCKQYSEMLEGNTIAPYKFKLEPMTFMFSLNYVNVESEVLPRIQQLQRASSLPVYEQNAMIATIVFSWNNRVKFDPVWFESIYEKVICDHIVNEVQPLVVNPGRLLMTNSIIYFQPFNNISTFPVLKIKINIISSTMKRRFLLKQIGLEIRWTEEKNEATRSLYVSFSNESSRDSFYDMLKNQEEFKSEYCLPESVTLKWQHGLISNYDYLLCLNSLADRTFQDLTQYPVFPWILSDYESETIDLKDIQKYRDLSKPIGALNSDRLGKLKERFGEMSDPRFLYGSHYSSPGFVIFYLARKYPKLMLCLQNGRFDHPDRIFNSMAETFNNCMQNMADFKELIPEFYDIAQKGEFLVNKNKINFGQRYDGTFVNNVILPAWANGSHENFVHILRSALESDYVSANLHKWIDLIFGYKQRGENAINADNLFYHLCYEGSINLDEVSDLSERHALEVQILEFGQIPKQLFKTPHASKLLSIQKPLQRSMSLKVNLKVTVEGHKDDITSLDLYEKIFVSCGKDGLLLCYDFKHCRRIRNVSISDSPLSKCVKVPNSPFLLLASWDNKILIYHLDYGHLSSTFEAHDDAISSMKLIDDVLFTGSWDGYVKVWKKTDNLSATFRVAKSMTSCLSVDDKIECFDVTKHKDYYLVVIGLQTGEIILWKYEETFTNKHFDRIYQHLCICKDIKFSSTAHYIASCSENRGVVVIDSMSHMVLFERITTNPITCLQWANQNMLLLMGDEGGICSIFNMNKGDISFQFSSHTGPISSLLVTEEKLIGVAGNDKGTHCLKIWELECLSEHS